jgi:hypothetical protein
MLLVLAFSILAFAVMGYHPGAEDDGVYLTAIKADLNPALYPHDAAFFKLQMRSSIFDTFMARIVQVTGIPLAWAELLVQSISILLVIWACWSIICRLFPENTARWAGVALVAAMFTLPVSGTALYLMDQYLHPRNLATALILLAVARILAAKQGQAVPLLILAFLFHPLMGALGISFCCVLALTLFEPLHIFLHSLRTRMTLDKAAPAAAIIPFGWVFYPPSQDWLQALRLSRYRFLRLYQWTWYEWLGAISPLVLFWLAARLARKRGQTMLARFSIAVLVYGIFQQAVAMVILCPLAPAGLTALEPMRYLHLVYLFMALVGGAYLGKFALKTRIWRWALFLLLANGGMFVAQRQLFASSSHLELPSMATGNPWLQAFQWIRLNTPQDAYFATDPQYLAAPGEDFHSFRALAERSQLADAIKDNSVVIKTPELGPDWTRQTAALKGWPGFHLADFQRLKNEFGVNWALVSYPQPAGLDCPWHNRTLSVCRIP